ncbi:MAG TPA: glycosyl hydrolase [Solirubrobacteraceae bacterium]
MRRTLIPIAVLIAVLAVPAGAGAYTLGVSDQQAGTFTNPLFAPLKFKAARYITPYDVMDSPADKAQLDAWLAGARAAHQRILISFEHSHRGTRAKTLPSVAAFTRELRKFKKAYPFVREISPWNEVNRRIFALPDGSYQGQPTWKSPKRVAQYYMAARKVFPGRTIVGIDILDEQNVNRTIKFLRSFLRHAKPTPKVIGFHNYSDTNRFSVTRTRRVLQTFRGKVWLTETGGIVKLGDSFPLSTSRAARALGCMFTLAKTNHRIQRLYVYQFNPAADPATARFDAGLINPDGTVRPGYAVVKSRKARSCRR